VLRVVLGLDGSRKRIRKRCSATERKNASLKPPRESRRRGERPALARTSAAGHRRGEHRGALELGRQLRREARSWERARADRARSRRLRGAQSARKPSRTRTRAGRWRQRPGAVVRHSTGSVRARARRPTGSESAPDCSRSSVRCSPGGSAPRQARREPAPRARRKSSGARGPGAAPERVDRTSKVRRPMRAAASRLPGGARGAAGEAVAARCPASCPGRRHSQPSRRSADRQRGVRTRPSRGSSPPNPTRR